LTTALREVRIFEPAKAGTHQRNEEEDTMAIAQALIGELEQEAATTRRVLQRVPADKLSWKPHPKSMSLGQLALHVATTPRGVAELVVQDVVEMPDFGERPAAASPEEALKALDESLAAAKRVLGAMDDARLQATWRLTRNGTDLMAMPRVAFLRSIMLNHWYHHRGQLSVYLRLLNVPVPSIYGPSADENPFVAAASA
jgi:uncharacterized damage-inducible protein DinB